MVSKIYIATDSSPVDMQSYELCCDMIDVVIDVSCIYGYDVYSKFSMIIQNNAHFRLMNYLQCIFHSSIQDDAGVETSSFDDRSASVIRLNNSTVLYLKV